MRNGKELEQLCCLGLPGEVLVPELLARLHEDVKSHWNIFFWFDAMGEIVNAYGEAPSFYEALPHYFAEFYHRGEYELMGRGTHAMFMRDPAPVEDLRGVVRDDRKVARSGFYQEILRRQGFHNATYLKVREAGRPLAMVLLGTGDAKPDIDAAERERLTRLAPFIAHGLAAPKSFALHEFEDDDSGVMVFDRAGALQHVSPSARMLLFLATHPQAGPRQVERHDRARLEVPEPVRRLCTDLGSALGGNGETRGAPTHLIENRWGRFAFRAYPLDPVRRENALTGVIVQRQIPLSLALWRRIRELGLPSKQAQVCFRLASGGAYAEIAREMNVSINTVTWHVRQIYARFDVHSASELSRKLLNRSAVS